MPVVLSLVGWQADARDDGGDGGDGGDEQGGAYAAAAAALVTKELAPRLSSAGAGGPASSRVTVAAGAAQGVAPGLAVSPEASPSHASAFDNPSAPPARGAVPAFLR